MMMTAMREVQDSIRFKIGRWSPNPSVKHIDIKDCFSSRINHSHSCSVPIVCARGVRSGAIDRGLRYRRSAAVKIPH
jgi:hypothetical protein